MKGKPQHAQRSQSGSAGLQDRNAAAENRNAEPQLGKNKPAKPGLGVPVENPAKPGLGVPVENPAKPGLGAPGKNPAKTRLGKPWYSRGYLPHLDSTAVLQFVTFRLADALPQEMLHRLEVEITQLPIDRQAIQRRKRIEQWLDAGMGCCALCHPRLAAVMQETLLKFDGQRYRLLVWCIMPNHVHVLIRPMEKLSRTIQSWKSYTGRWAMAHKAELGLGAVGKRFWMREYWDRFIRDERHFHSVVTYIHENPVKAGLCNRAEDWTWSSARVRGGIKPGN